VKISQIFMYLGGTIALCVSVAWTLHNSENKQRQDAIAGIEKLLSQEAAGRRESLAALERQLAIVYEGLRMDIRELRDRIKYKE
jgi:hypothetical protein